MNIAPNRSFAAGELKRQGIAAALRRAVDGNRTGEHHDALRSLRAVLADSDPNVNVVLRLDPHLRYQVARSLVHGGIRSDPAIPRVLCDLLEEPAGHVRGLLGSPGLALDTACRNRVAWENLLEAASHPHHVLIDSPIVVLSKAIRAYGVDKNRAHRKAVTKAAEKLAGNAAALKVLRNDMVSLDYLALQIEDADMAGVCAPALLDVLARSIASQVGPAANIGRDLRAQPLREIAIAVPELA